jgi:hypothetical protein
MSWKILTESHSFGGFLFHELVIQSRITILPQGSSSTSECWQFAVKNPPDGNSSRIAKAYLKKFNRKMSLK